MSEFVIDERELYADGTEYPSTRFIDNGHYVDYEQSSDWFDVNYVDVEDEAEATRQEAEVRLRTQSNELKQFHDKICLRVTARERQHRLEAQRAQKYLDEKCARIFSSTEAKQHIESSESARLSTRQCFQNLKEVTTTIPKDCPMGKHIQKMLHLDAQIRKDLLRSSEIPRSNPCSDHEQNNNASESAESPVLLPEQRVALYATVRRQYMEMNRAQVQNNVWRGASHPPTAKSPLPNASVAAAVRGSRTRRAGNSDHTDNEEQLVSSTGVKIIDMTEGCDVRVHRQVTTSSTPWRKKKAKSSKPQKATTEHERFLRALQAQIGAPALCSCGKTGPISISPQPCANNCALYKQPKKREKLLTSVYKQQQQDNTPAAASPIR